MKRNLSRLKKINKHERPIRKLLSRLVETKDNRLIDSVIKNR